MASEKDIVEAICEVGRRKQISDVNLTFFLGLGRSGLNRESSDFWSRVCSQLTLAQIKELFVGLVIFERDLRLLGGSVSGNIFVFRILDRRMHPNDMYEMAKWAIDARGENAYTPFGSIKGDRLFEAFGRDAAVQDRFTFLAYLFSKGDEERARKEVQRKKDEVTKRQLILSGKSLIVSVHKSKSTEARKRRDAELLLASGMSQTERLRWLACTKLPLAAIPTNLFDAAEVENYDITSKLMEAIVQKLTGEKGTWGSLRLAIEKLIVSGHAQHKHF
jgi:hypothetical protein